MPLVKATLVDDLKTLFEDLDNAPGDAQDAGKRLAEAYASYAGKGIAGPLTPVVATAQQALGPALGAGLEQGRQSGADAVAAQMDLAFVAFWVSVTFTGPAAGVAVGVPAVLTTGLASAFKAGAASSSVTAGDQASAIGDVLNTWTGTVMVTVTPPGSPVPLA